MVEKTAQTSEVPDLGAFLNCIEELRLIEPDMPAQKVAAFLIAATTERCTLQQLADRLGVYLSTANRNVAALGEEHWTGKPGLGLLTTEWDVSGQRPHKVLKLTKKGERLARSLTYHIRG